MKIIFLILFFPLALSAQYSPNDIMRARIDSIAKRKADSAISAVLPQLQTKLNTTDTPTIRQRAVSMIVQQFLKDYTRTDSMATIIAAINSALTTKLSPSDTAKLRADINAALAGMNSMSNLASRVDSVRTKTLFTQTALQTVAGTLTKSPMVGAGVGSLTIPANTLTVGKTYRMSIRGVYSTPLLNIATVTCRMELNGAAITTGAASSLLASANNAAYEAEQIITIRSVGTNGILVAIGGLNFSSAGGSRVFVDWNTGTGTALINTTVANTFTPTIQFSNNNAGNSVSSVICTFEALN
jgi:hypothetical protein